MWLLPRHSRCESQRGRPRHGGALELLEGPERIESGWWDGGDIARDYYVAQGRHWRACCGSIANATAHAWFLHGIFG